ncbi:hypothetical protein DH2020_046862 [Rehmannia glutinosa]|uniref:Alanine--tRNA ligase n=1 Tax=Rehmannia glutinosa TaxID=99300 RepID=A0ABR0UA71_REHGL
MNNRRERTLQDLCGSIKSPYILALTIKSIDIAIRWENYGMNEGLPHPRPLWNIALFLPTHFYSSRSSIIPTEEASSPASMGSQATDFGWRLPGMNQFKPIFLGTVDPNTELSKLSRACNTQKCIRAGGKHNDLDDVGKDTYHHTFFEMLGNWSFGDYFKNEAIGWAWELLTKASSLLACINCLGAIYATYFGGDEKLGLPADVEARDNWLKFLPPSRVLPFGCKDNFWEMGDTGPCGPCTEIHFDRIGGRDAASFVNNDDPTVIEIWNLVFIQFNRESDGSLKSLPAKHVDTGMGFERLTSILQNKMSNYDTDIFFPIFDAIQQVRLLKTCFDEIRKAKNSSEKDLQLEPAIFGKVGSDDVDNVDMAYRVVADHIRTISFAIADGSCPGLALFFLRSQILKHSTAFVGYQRTIMSQCNDGREYVLRRILRRAVRYGTEVLKAQQGFFNGLVKVVVEVMGDVFPELKEHAIKIREIIADEETSFGRTLTKDAFDLWDTYGFPLDLTQLMAEERGLSVDVEGFNMAMDKARERSRRAQNKQAGGTIGMDADATASLHNKGIAATNDSFKFTWFKDHASVIKAVYTGSEFLESVSPGEEVGIILETTSFYAEQGGQIFDTGIVEGPDGVFEVSNVQIYGGFVLHIGSFSGKTGRLYIGDKVICKVNYDRRVLIAPNHTCTHMLNYALREVLGNHVDQKGSIVLPEKLRFDFSHGKPVKPEELRKIEAIVNEQIQAQLDVFSKETRLADAKRINGLRAVFGEVYPDPVRVVAIGRKVEDLLASPENEEWLSISAELCGGKDHGNLIASKGAFMLGLSHCACSGTHISNTREAKAFALLSEEGIAKGIRRLTGVTMDCAFKALDLASSLEQEVDEASHTEGSILEQKVASLNSRVEGASIPSAKKADLKAKLSVLQSQVIKAKKKIAEEHMQKAIELAIQTADGASSNGKAYCISLVDVGADTAAIREAVVKVMEQKGMAIMVFSRDEKVNKAFVCAGVPEQDGKYRQLNVTEWLKNVLDLISGKGGGGKGGLAQGQGSDVSRIEAAMDVAESFAAMKLT